MSSDTFNLSMDNTPPPYRGGCPVSTRPDLSTCPTPISALRPAATSASAHPRLAALLTALHARRTTSSEAHQPTEAMTHRGDATGSVDWHSSPPARTAATPAASQPVVRFTISSRFATDPTCGWSTATPAACARRVTPAAPCEANRGIDITAILSRRYPVGPFEGITSRSGGQTWA